MGCEDASMLYRRTIQMNRRFLGIYLAGAILTCGIAWCAQSEEVQQPCLYYKAVPPELTRQIDEKLKKFAQSHPLPDEKAVGLLLGGDFGKMTAIRDGKLEPVPLSQAAKEPKAIDMDRYSAVNAF